MNAFVTSCIIKRRHHAASVRTPLARMLPRVIDAGDPGLMSAMPVRRVKAALSSG